MKRSIFFTSIYVVIFIVVSVPLILNIKINEVSNKIDEINTQIYFLERRKNSIDLKHHESYSISSIEKLAKSHSYKRLEISQKINKLEIPYKLKSEQNEKIAILGFGK
jgi:cell division protein FtsL